MKVEETGGMSIYKNTLELQKKLVEMMIQGNLKTDQSQNVSENNQQKIENVIQGNKVSIYV
ncbi:hypothetical protein [Persephonella sp.]